MRSSSKSSSEEKRFVKPLVRRSASKVLDSASKALTLLPEDKPITKRHKGHINLSDRGAFGAYLRLRPQEYNLSSARIRIDLVVDLSVLSR